MDYGIGWNSGPESPPCLFQRDTSSFRHVRRGILPSYTVFRFFPGAVYGDLSHCLRFRVSHAPFSPVQGSRGNSYSPAICFLCLPYVNPSCYVLDQTSSGYRKSKWNDRILLLLYVVEGNVYFQVVIQLERSSNFEIFFYTILKSCYWKLHNEEEILSRKNISPLFFFFETDQIRKKKEKLDSKLTLNFK